MKIDKAELLQILQEELTIDISKRWPYDPFGSATESEIVVKVYFMGELVTDAVT